MWASALPLDAQRCSGCDHPRPRYTGGYASVRTNLSAMLSKVRFAGCEVCLVLSNGILSFLADPLCGVAKEAVDELRIDFNLAGSRRSLEVVLLNTPVTLSFFASRATPWLTKHLPDLPLGREIPPATSSAEGLSWAMEQLRTCQETHLLCNNGSLQTPLPSRVLDVLAEGGRGVRLHETAPGETAPYVCLSHCWGPKPFLRTLSGSLDAHRSAIDWARLPQTFRDAVEFTRQLGGGVRYLWIDSLCIVQDDQDDWRREAGRMASIYQGAVLVLSAAKSHGAYGGLYAEVPAACRTYTVKYTPRRAGRSRANDNNEDDEPDDCPAPDTERDRTISHIETIHLRRALTHTNRLLTPYHGTNATLPILTRGWILQERFLSRRMLHFGPEELSFECLESATCQCSPCSPTTTSDAATIPSSSTTTTSTSLQPAWYTHMLDRSARPKRYYSAGAWRGMAAGERGRAWRRLVEDYTRLRLTFERDVFPAVAGMAQVMQGVRGDRARYLAGLWGEEEEEGGKIKVDVADLLWHVELPPIGHVRGAGDAGLEGEEGWEKTWVVRPRQWRAPSWSWASVRAPVEFVNGDEGVQAECETVDVRCKPVGPDPMGELREGASYLVLRGRLIPALASFKEQKGNQLKPWNVIDLDILDSGHMKNLWVDADCKGLLEQPRVYCLLVGRKLPSKALLCLVLVRVLQHDGALSGEAGPDGEGHLLFRRIGLVEIFGGPPSPVPWGWVHNLLAKGEDTIVRIV